MWFYLQNFACGAVLSVFYLLTFEISTAVPYLVDKFQFLAYFDLEFVPAALFSYVGSHKSTVFLQFFTLVVAHLLGFLSFVRGFFFTKNLREIVLP